MKKVKDSSLLNRQEKEDGERIHSLLIFFPYYIVCRWLKSHSVALDTFQTHLIASGWSPLYCLCELCFYNKLISNFMHSILCYDAENSWKLLYHFIRLFWEREGKSQPEFFGRVPVIFRGPTSYFLNLVFRSPMQKAVIVQRASAFPSEGMCRNCVIWLPGFTLQHPSKKECAKLR